MHLSSGQGAPSVNSAPTQWTNCQNPYQAIWVCLEHVQHLQDGNLFIITTICNLGNLHAAGFPNYFVLEGQDGQR